MLGSIVGNAWTDFRGMGRGSATRTLWAGIRSAAEQFGAPLPSWREVNQARAWAAEQVRAARTFTRAPDTETDWSRMIATTANSRPLAERDAAPRHTFVYQIARTIEGESLIEWRTASLGRTPPTTVGDLRDQVTETVAQEYPGEEGEELAFTGVGFVAAV